MSADKRIPVDEDNFYEVLVKLRDLRAWAVTAKADPWAFRQAMITIMAIDTHIILAGDVTNMELNKFDMEARAKAREFIESIPEELRG